MLLPSIILLLLTLNPYTLVGPLGYYAAAPLISIGLFHIPKFVSKNVVIAFCACIAISFIGVVSSIIHGIAQIEHLKASLSIFISFLIGVGLFNFLKKKVGIDGILASALHIGLINSAVILLEVQFPSFRAAIESFFVTAGNIDWTDGFRYRGFASSGGASLSVLSAAFFYICLYLYRIKKIGMLMTMASLSILLWAVFFIGRTGVLLIGAVSCIFLISNSKSNPKGSIAVVSIFIFIYIIGLDFLKDFLTNSYGNGFYEYSLGFFLEGRQGIENEGTVGIIAEFLTTVPLDFPEVLIGYGFYGGSDFSPWTDSGYARMFLSVGFFFGILFYALSFYIFRKSAIGKGALFWPLILILAFAEAKEGMLFAGYSSRLIFILLGFWAAQRAHAQQQALHSRTAIRQSNP